MTLDEFVEQEKARLDEFRAYWISMHNEYPDDFPLAFGDDNSGIWTELMDMRVPTK